MTTVHTAPQTRKKDKKKFSAQDCQKLRLTEALYQGCSSGRVEVVFSGWKTFLAYPSESAWREASGFADELSFRVFLKPAAQGFGLAVGLALPTVIASTGSEWIAEPSWLIFTIIHFSVIYMIDLDIFNSTFSILIAVAIAIFSWSRSDAGDVSVLECLLVLVVCLLHCCRVLSQDPKITLASTLALRLVVTLFYKVKMHSGRRVAQLACLVALYCELFGHQGSARTVAVSTSTAWFDVGALRLVVEATYQWAISDTRTGGIVLIIVWGHYFSNAGSLISAISSIQGNRVRLVRTPSGPASSRQG